ncbi:hypothetical protein [Microbacterium sp.]|uniref:hypothetical protein n=1 Tax=Microbacterium sp. TaxID=51671 RepID=UPI0039E3630D
MTLTLIANALDAFPWLTESQRADVFRAIESAPVTPPPRGFFALNEWHEAYYASPAVAAWQRIRGWRFTPLDPENPRPTHMTLEEAAHYESCPTQAEILMALERAARYAKENAR